MSGATEHKENTKWWTIPLYILIFLAGRDVLEIWFVKPIAAGIAIMLALFLLFKFILKPRLRFITPIFLSFVIAAGYIATFFGIPYLLCHRLGIIGTAGLAVGLFFLLFRWIIRLIHGQAKGDLWPWVITSLGFGLIAMVIAYLNPGEFCK